MIAPPLANVQETFICNGEPHVRVKWDMAAQARKEGEERRKREEKEGKGV
jgi:hypothetical protein